VSWPISRDMPWPQCEPSGKAACTAEGHPRPKRARIRLAASRGFPSLKLRELAQ